MSHVASMKTKITNPQALVRALIRAGIPQSRIEVHEKAIQCCGYHTEEKYMANVVVRRKVSKVWGGCDIGWEKTADGTYVGHIDAFYYADLGQHYSTEWQTQVATFSNVEAAKMEMDSRDIEYDETRDDKGRIQIVARFKLEEDGRSLLLEGR